LRFGCLVHVYLPAGTIILLVGHVRHDYATAPKARLGPQGNSAVSPTVLARCVPNKVGGTWPPMKLVGCVGVGVVSRLPTNRYQPYITGRQRSPRLRHVRHTFAACPSLRRQRLDLYCTDIAL